MKVLSATNKQIANILGFRFESLPERDVRGSTHLLLDKDGNVLRSVDREYGFGSYLPDWESDASAALELASSERVYFRLNTSFGSWVANFAYQQAGKQRRKWIGGSANSPALAICRAWIAYRNEVSE